MMPTDTHLLEPNQRKRVERAKKLLDRYGVTLNMELHVRPTIRGPFGWKVVAG